VAGQSFRQFMSRGLPQLPGITATLQDWTDHLTTIFPEVRLKRYMEMRGADSGQWRRLCALPALWVGLLYDELALDGAFELVKHWTAEDRQTLRDAVPRLALDAKAGGRRVADVAADVLALARQGLDRRHRLGCRGRSESQFLDPLDEIVATGRTQAEELLALYEGPWQRDITRIFRDFAF
jgi:glutamate--cysteine ligase